MTVAMTKNPELIWSNKLGMAVVSGIYVFTHHYDEDDWKNETPYKVSFILQPATKNKDPELITYDNS